MPETVLAVGAEGQAAGLVVPALAARGAKVRALIRRAELAGPVLARGASETVVGDLTDPASIARALRGVASVFYIAPAFLADEAAIGKALVSAAVEAGVRRIVFSSVIHPVLSGLANHAAKAPVEEAILESDLEYTLLHPALFYQNYAAGWARTVESGVLAEPWSAESGFSRVDYRDVAEVAALALTEDRLIDGTFELCAPGVFDRHAVASLLGQVLGRDIRAARLDPATLGPEAAPMRPMFERYDRSGLRGNPLTLAAILGREPRTLRAYFEECAAASRQEP